MDTGGSKNCRQDRRAGQLNILKRLKVGRCSLRSLVYPENLPASYAESVVPSLPHAVKGKPAVLTHP